MARTARTKYYKGLGTSTAADGKRYFAHPDRYLVRMTGAEAARDQMQLLFDKTAAAGRKAWLDGMSTDLLQDATRAAVKEQQSITHFIDNQAAQYSVYSVERNIPSAVDGLKPCQRKVLCTALKLPEGQEMKVAQLGPATAEKMLYAHGEASLNNTIINMAQDFTGANNVELLRPEGQFGSRLQGGKDAAAPRYIFVKMNPLTRLIFPKEDDPVLGRRVEEGQEVEPLHYAPVIPAALLNGITGIAVGYSSSIPCVNPRALIRAVRAHIDNTPDAAPPLLPWYRGFLGEVEVAPDGKSFQTHGVARWDGRRKVRVTELPVHVSVEKMQEHLARLAEDPRLRPSRRATRT